MDTSVNSLPYPHIHVLLMFLCLVVQCPAEVVLPMPRLHTLQVGHMISQFLDGLHRLL